MAPVPAQWPAKTQARADASSRPRPPRDRHGPASAGSRKSGVWTLARSPTGPPGRPGRLSGGILPLAAARSPQRPILVAAAARSALWRSGQIILGRFQGLYGYPLLCSPAFERDITRLPEKNEGPRSFQPNLLQ